MRNTGLLFVTILMILTGCATPRQMTLFSSKSSSTVLTKAPCFVIAPNDELEIRITAVNAEAVKLYSSAGTSFVVNGEGVVDIPVIGQVKLAGKTTEEAKNYLTDLVKDQVKNPIVLLTISNASITILGEVENPTRFFIKEPLALPQAIGVVGGFTKNANLKDVLIQRTEGDTLVQYHVNLLTDELFSSPCYYLQKGDMVNVRPMFAQ